MHSEKGNVLSFNFNILIVKIKSETGKMYAIRIYMSLSQSTSLIVAIEKKTNIRVIDFLIACKFAVIDSILTIKI